MYDPMTVVCDIHYPWSKVFFITIWHIDPEKDGTDDSCDWFGRKRKLLPREKAIVDAVWDLETILDNHPFYPDHPAHKAFQPLHRAINDLSRKTGWRLHPRWHIWHWRLQIHPIQSLKRRLFTRCESCGKRFGRDEPVVSTDWKACGPRWFRSEPHVFHGRCLTKCDGAGEPPQKTGE